MNFCINEEILQVIKDTVAEMKKNNEEVPRNFFVGNELNTKHRRKLVDHFVGSFPEKILAALDTSFLKNGSEGFAFTNATLFGSDKYLKDSYDRWFALRNVSFDELAFVEIYPDEPNFCYLAFKDGHAIKAFNDKYNVFIVKILKAILNFYEYKFICIENIRSIEEKNLTLHINEKDLNYNIVNFYYENVDLVYQNLSEPYKSKLRLPLNLKGYLDKLYKENDDNPNRVAISMMEDGFDRFVYMAYGNKTEQDNKDIFEEIGLALRGLRLSDFLEFSMLCFLKEFSYGEMNALEHLIETSLRLFEVVDPNECFELLTAVSNLFDKMLENKYSFKQKVSDYKKRFYKAYTKLPAKDINTRLELLDKRQKYFI